MSKSHLKLLVLVIVLGAYLLVVRNIPNAKEYQAINFGWLTWSALIAIYIGLRWVCGKAIKPLLARTNANLSHPLFAGAATGLGVLLIIPAAALVAVAIPGVAFIHPEVGVMIMLALSTYFFIIETAWAYIEAHYKNNNG